MNLAYWVNNGSNPLGKGVSREPCMFTIPNLSRRRPHKNMMTKIKRVWV